MKRNKKRILLAVAAVLAVLGGLYALNTPSDIPLTRVTPQTAELTFIEQGLVSGGQVIQIYPLTAGRVLEVAVKEGQRVNAGDVLCTIDSEATLHKIDQTKSAIMSYQAQLQTWRAQHEKQSQDAEKRRQVQQVLIAQSEQDLALAQKELGRISVLYESGFVALTQLEQAEAAVQGLELALQGLQQELQLISSADEGSQMDSYYESLIAIEQNNLELLEKELSHTKVTAVSDGVITALPVQQINVVSSASPVAEITTTEALVIEVHVPTNDVASIAPGDTVLITVSRREGDILFEGEVAEIDNTATLRISPLGLEERRVKVKVIPGSSAPADIGIGYDVSVTFTQYKEEEQLTVPKTALFQEEGQDMLWLVQEGVLRAVPVVAGVELRTEVVIVSGLEADSLVVTDANDDTLKDGLAVITENE